MPELETVERVIDRERGDHGGVRGPNAMVLREPDAMKWLDIPRDQLRSTLSASLYPGAKPESIDMVLEYCEAARLNVMLKPVHIVPMNVKKAGTDKYEWRDIVMPGINHYRTQASRSGTYAGKSEPEFGPTVERKWGNIVLNVPEWCKVTVKRLIGSYQASFTALEYWEENFATAGRDKPWPNAMWTKRPKGQLAKVAEAQALRMAFPELLGAESAEEMEGKVIDLEAVAEQPRQRAVASLDHFAGATGPDDEDGADDDADAANNLDAEQNAADNAGSKAAAGASDAVPTMPPKALKAFVEKADWAPGWKWLNEVMEPLPQPARQSLAVSHNKLLWAVYNSDLEAKKGGGPQSRAAAAFTEKYALQVPPVESGNDG